MRLTCEQRATHAVGNAARPHLARQGPLPVLRGASGDQSPLHAHRPRTSASQPDRHVADARAEERSRQKATVEVGGDKRPRVERTATSFRQSFWHSLPLMSPVSLGALRCSQLVNEDAQQGTGCSFDQFLPPWRQRGHRVVRGQFAYKVVNACLRARLHSLDDANIDPPAHSVRPYRFTSRAALSASSSAPLDGATPLRGVVQQNLCTVQAARHFPSLPSCVWSNTDARLAECEFVAPWQLIDARQMSGMISAHTGGRAIVQLDGDALFARIGGPVSPLSCSPLSNANVIESRCARRAHPARDLTMSRCLRGRITPCRLQRSRSARVPRKRSLRCARGSSSSFEMK